MSIVGSNLAQSVAATNQAQRAQAKEKEKAESKRPRDARSFEDAYEASKVQAAEAVRNLKGNDQEETHEDRQEHAGYDPRVPNKKHLDVEG